MNRDVLIILMGLHYYLTPFSTDGCKAHPWPLEGSNAEYIFGDLSSASLIFYFLRNLRSTRISHIPSLQPFFLFVAFSQDLLLLFLSLLLVHFQ
jgi:hypothetical protein